jgi:Gpi18-like mannosyltransferase
MANLEAQTGNVNAGDTPVVEFSFNISAIAVLLIAAGVMRLAFAALPGFDVDMGVFSFWARQLAENGPWDFYDTDFFTDYAPGYMYVLLVIGKIAEVFSLDDEQLRYLLKLPSIAADLASAYLLYKFLDKHEMNVRLAAAALYLAFPPAILIGPIWGQVDSLLAFFLLLSTYFITRGRPVAGAAAFTIGFLIKPQAIAALPVLAFWILRDHWPYKDGQWSFPKVLLECVGVGLGLTLVLIIPFFTYEPWRLISELYDATRTENYQVNSFWAYNLWTIGGLFDSGFKTDLQEFMGVSHRVWGQALFAGSQIAIIAAVWRTRNPGALALAVGLSVLCFFLFLTRMHERYVFAAFLPLLAACVVLNSRILWGLFTVLSVVHMANLYHVYAYYNVNELRWEWLYKWFEKPDFLGTGLETVQVLSIIMVGAFVALLALTFYLSWRSRDSEGASPPPPPPAEPTTDLEFNPS